MSSGDSATSTILVETTQVPSSTTDAGVYHIYDYVELKTKHEVTEQYDHEEVELSNNAGDGVSSAQNDHEEINNAAYNESTAQNDHEEIELSANAAYGESTAQNDHEEIELSNNVAYGRVQN